MIAVNQTKIWNALLVLIHTSSLRGIIRDLTKLWSRTQAIKTLKIYHKSLMTMKDRLNAE